MALSIATWNINSVRLRIDNVVRFLAHHQPDILCLQETKCPNGQFPSSRLKELGYSHIAEHGQKGYNGVAIVSRIPFSRPYSESFCGNEDCRHIAATFEGQVPFILHNFYVPAGGDEPDPERNEKFAHKLQFLAEMESWSKAKTGWKGGSAVLVGDLNIAPHEHDVWSHKDLLKVVSHTPIECEGLLRILNTGGWRDLMRQHVPLNEKLYTWWSYRAKDWEISNRGRRLDHIWAHGPLADASTSIEVLKETRGWTQTSDHVPVIAKFDC